MISDVLPRAQVFLSKPPASGSTASRPMIGLKSTLNVIDNSGALIVECVNVLKNKVNNGWGSVGDEIVCVVKSARPVSAATQASVTAVKVRRGDVRRAVIVRTKKPVRRPDGRFVRFDDNAAVLLNNKREMLGTRIGGVVNADLKLKGWGKIAAVAPKVRSKNPLVVHENPETSAKQAI
ncbi:mitochondrial 60s ribosomal protein l38 [Moniliophthora roreri MCA 2997]|uniref:Large ribosomal subunit protein uL14m n=1 Tax=Moniliophthora roreri (strain MCA 2997) TaxID=1381753 RepID=V2WM96_MONRO|nr:mitochondrial 60s ribosomal protein l38 [Moniliophthora roreri MCA 2997]